MQLVPDQTHNTPGSGGAAPASGLPVLAFAEWQSGLALLERMPEQMPVFLQGWAERMRLAGYLSYTTARRTDCMASLNALRVPMLRHGANTAAPSFEWLTQHSDGWQQALVESGLRHVQRGINASMFLGCFKTFICAVEDALQSFEADPGATANACTLLHMYASAFEVLWMDVCINTQQDTRILEHDALYRLLTLEKCRFENVLNTSSDGIVIMDSSCRIRTVNRAFTQFAGERPACGHPVWQVLGLEAQDPDDFFRLYPLGQTAEICPFGGDEFFRFSLAPLGDVSLASDEYLMLLTNITPQVLKRQLLEQTVARRTAQLVADKQRIEEMNITLRTVLHTVEGEREKLREEVADKVRQLVLPLVARLEAEPEPAVRRAYGDMLREQVKRLLPQGKNTKLFAGFTLAEAKVCELVEAGHSTKEIAAMLRISPDTVQTHRRSIRRKMGIRGRNAQLAAELHKQRHAE